MWGSYSGVSEYSNILDIDVTSQKIGIISVQYLLWAGKNDLNKVSDSWFSVVMKITVRQTLHIEMESLRLALCNGRCGLSSLVLRNKENHFLKSRFLRTNFDNMRDKRY
jgi:hypothetical protein